MSCAFTDLWHGGIAVCIFYYYYYYYYYHRHYQVIMIVIMIVIIIITVVVRITKATRGKLKFSLAASTTDNSRCPSTNRSIIINTIAPRYLSSQPSCSHVTRSEPRMSSWKVIRCTDISPISLTTRAMWWRFRCRWVTLVHRVAPTVRLVNQSTAVHVGAAYWRTVATALSSRRHIWDIPHSFPLFVLILPLNPCGYRRFRGVSDPPTASEWTQQWNSLQCWFSTSRRQMMDGIIWPYVIVRLLVPEPLFEWRYRRIEDAEQRFLTYSTSSEFLAYTRLCVTIVTNFLHVVRCSVKFPATCHCQSYITRCHPNGT